MALFMKKAGTQLPSVIQVESLETHHMKTVLYFMGSNLFEVSDSTKSLRSICGVMK